MISINIYLKLIQLIMYCVYLTSYAGNKLPAFYVGSSSLKRVYAGYCGSVRSKKFKAIWDDELKNNRHLFSVSILSIHDTRAKALKAELEYQILNNVIQSNEFINLSLARPNDYFGNGISEKDHPVFGKKLSEETKQKISKNHHDVSGKNNPMFGKPGNKSMLGKSHSYAAKQKMKLNHWDCSGKNNPMFGKLGKDHPMFGKKHSEETKQKMKSKKPILVCPHCNKKGGKPIMLRFHFDNCKMLNFCI